MTGVGSGVGSVGSEVCSVVDFFTLLISSFGIHFKVTNALMVPTAGSEPNIHSKRVYKSLIGILSRSHTGTFFFTFFSVFLSNSSIIS